MSYNFYCDESCHIEKAGKPVMVIGAVKCQKHRASVISKEIMKIKVRHGLAPHFEIKSTKISPAKADFYKDLLTFFINNDELQFRTVIADKRQLDHASFSQKHDEWYYKMYYLLVLYFGGFSKDNYVYMDYKDSCSVSGCRKLQEVLNNKAKGVYEFTVQPINSVESNIMQLSDLLIGLTCYSANESSGSATKMELIEYLKTQLNISFSSTNYNRKFNILVWEGMQHV